MHVPYIMSFLWRVVWCKLEGENQALRNKDRKVRTTAKGIDSARTISSLVEGKKDVES